MASRTDELLPLTALRGIAAWWVVLFHLRLFLVPYLPAGAMAVLARGNLAVDLFFLLSGFVIHLNYAERVTPDAASVGDFLFRRFARIYRTEGKAEALAMWARLRHAPGYIARRPSEKRSPMEWMPLVWRRLGPAVPDG